MDFRLAMESTYENTQPLSRVCRVGMASSLYFALFGRGSIPARPARILIPSLFASDSSRAHA